MYRDNRNMTDVSNYQEDRIDAFKRALAAKDKEIQSLQKQVTEYEEMLGQEWRRIFPETDRQTLLLSA